MVKSVNRQRASRDLGGARDRRSRHTNGYVNAWDHRSCWLLNQTLPDAHRCSPLRALVMQRCCTWAVGVHARAGRAQERADPRRRRPPSTGRADARWAALHARRTRARIRPPRDPRDCCSPMMRGHRFRNQHSRAPIAEQQIRRLPQRCSVEAHIWDLLMEAVGRTGWSAVASSSCWKARAPVARVRALGSKRLQFSCSLVDERRSSPTKFHLKRNYNASSSTTVRIQCMHVISTSVTVLCAGCDLRIIVRISVYITLYRFLRISLQYSYVRVLVYIFNLKVE